MGNTHMIKQVLKAKPSSKVNEADLATAIFDGNSKDTFDQIWADSGMDEACEANLDTILGTYKELGLTSNQDLADEIEYSLADLQITGILDSEWSIKCDSNRKVLYNMPNDKLKQYFTKQYFKMFMLYFFIKPYYGGKVEESEDFIKKLAKSLNEDPKSTSTSSLLNSFGLAFSLEAIKEFRHKKPEMLVNILNGMVSKLQDYKSGDLRSLNKEFFTLIENTLNSQRDFMIDLINDENIPEPTKGLALRVVMLIANARASGEDYLIVYNLIVEHKLTLDVTQELNLALSNCEESPEEINDGLHVSEIDRIKIKTSDIIKFESL